jgi:hypothetical protein
MSAKKQLLHLGIDVTVNGETLTIKPFPFGKLPTVSAKLAPAFSAMQGLSEGASIAYNEILEAGGDGLMDVLAIAAGKPQGFMDTVYDYDEGKALAMAVFEVNKDMLLKKILPDLMKLLAAPAKVTEAVAA